jgi:hypothetical protein
MSFPGSAFYHLADPPEAALVALPESDPLARGAAGGRKPGALIDAGPAASAFTAGSGAHLERAQTCLAQAIWYEAASESEAGQRAVAQVVLNRVAHPSWPASVCGVVYQGAGLSTGCQFSFACDGSLSRRRPASHKGSAPGWASANRIAREALGGAVYSAIGHATHYHTLFVDPYWARTLEPVGVIGAHIFYRSRGPAGEKAAFTARYAGVEPVSLQEGALSNARDHTPAPPPASERIMPLAVLETAEASEGENAAAAAEAERSGRTREKFSRSGRWKVDPARLGAMPADAPQEPSRKVP